MTLLAGVNQLYAELGTNPKDRTTQTAQNRGFSISAVKDMLRQVGYEVK